MSVNNPNRAIKHRPSASTEARIVEVCLKPERSATTKAVEATSRYFRQLYFAQEMRKFMPCYRVRGLASFVDYMIDYQLAVKKSLSAADQTKFWHDCMTDTVDGRDFTALGHRLIDSGLHPSSIYYRPSGELRTTSGPSLRSIRERQKMLQERWKAKYGNLPAAPDAAPDAEIEVVAPVQTLTPEEWEFLKAQAYHEVAPLPVAPTESELNLVVEPDDITQLTAPVYDAVDSDLTSDDFTPELLEHERLRGLHLHYGTDSD